MLRGEELATDVRWPICMRLFADRNEATTRSGDGTSAASGKGSSRQGQGARGPQSRADRRHPARGQTAATATSRTPRSTSTRGGLHGVAEELEATGVDFGDEQASRLDSSAMAFSGVSEALATVRERETLGRPKPAIAPKTRGHSKGRQTSTGSSSASVSSRTALQPV